MRSGQGHGEPNPTYIPQANETYELMAKHTGRPIEQIERDTDRDRFMSAQEAHEYGIIDNIVTSRTELAENKPLVSAG